MVVAWIPACAGMTEGGRRGDEGRRVLPPGAQGMRVGGSALRVMEGVRRLGDRRAVGRFGRRLMGWWNRMDSCLRRNDGTGAQGMTDWGGGILGGVSAPALDGLFVIEISETAAGAYAGRLLAGMGAEVLMVEPPGGTALRRWGGFRGDVPDREGSAMHRASEPTQAVGAAGPATRRPGGGYSAGCLMTPTSWSPTSSVGSVRSEGWNRRG